MTLHRIKKKRSQKPTQVMEQREHARIQIPLVVELSHPSVGKLRTTARDISEGGVFVALPDASIRPGAKLKVQLLNLFDIDNQPTPTVDMEVKRVTDEGVGLAFLNRTGEHLWASAERMRDELQIGRDYFQVLQSIVVTHTTRGILLLQHNGKWVLPGHYLMVGEQSVNALRAFVDEQLGLSLTTRPRPVATDSAPDVAVPQAATLSVIFSSSVDEHGVTLAVDSRYAEPRWVSKRKDIQETTFASEFQRSVAGAILSEILEQDPPNES
jgi:hypothetical protein